MCYAIFIVSVHVFVDVRNLFLNWIGKKQQNFEASFLFSGHKSEIYTAKFHPSGNWLASAGMERLIYLWNVYGECENVR